MKRMHMLAAAGILLWGFGNGAWSQQTGERAGAAAGRQPDRGQAAGAEGAQSAQGARGPQVGISPQFGGINRTPWFADPGVQQQLRLNEQQIAQLNQLYGSQFTRYQQQLQQLQNRRLTPAEQLQLRRQLRQTFNRDFAQGLDERFRDAQFRERFNQLNWQFQGLGAFYDPTIQERINLTPQQQQQIDTLLQQWNERLQQLYQTARDNPPEMRERFRELQQARIEQLQQILTERQFQDWERIIGDPYEFPASAFFPTDVDVSSTDDLGTAGSRNRPEEKTNP
jgi:hypothetical protein